MTFGLVLLISAGTGLVAVVSNRLTVWAKVPPPALFLVGAAVAAKVVPALHAPPERTVTRVVTVALVLILFDGGMHIGWRRLKSAAGPITVVGVVGTIGTAAAGALLVHLAFGVGWYAALLVATAVAPTDPAVVFSVLGQREIAGLSGTILEGESGANDPVGIALMASLISAGGLSFGAFGHVGIEFVLQMGVGLAVGAAGGGLLVWFMRRVGLPSEGLYPLRTLASALVLFGVATVAHGSGFLAVFVAGIVIGDQGAPFKREIERFHSALASLGEIVAFVVLGLTIDLTVLARSDVWVPGLVLGVALAVIIRPILVGLCLIPAHLKANQQAFVLFAGLKGAVPILLGSSLFAAPVSDPDRLYGIVVIVVVFSVVAQGGLVPKVAQLLHLPMTSVEPEPWALGIRLRTEPDSVHRLTVTVGSPADGHTVGDIDNLADNAWVSFVLREGQVLPVTGSTTFHAADDVVILAPPDQHEALIAAFNPPPPT